MEKVWQVWLQIVCPSSRASLKRSPTRLFGKVLEPSDIWGTLIRSPIFLAVHDYHPRVQPVFESFPLGC